MWKCVPDFRIPIWNLILSDNSAEEARRAAEEAAMWRSLFWIAVIVIAVLLFVIWKQRRRYRKKPEELQSAIITCENPEKEQKLFSRNGIRESHQ